MNTFTEFLEEEKKKKETEKLSGKKSKVIVDPDEKEIEDTIDEQMSQKDKILTSIYTCREELIVFSKDPKMKDEINATIKQLDSVKKLIEYRMR